MRTAVQKRVTSFGTFFATLTHEFCHHLDREKFGLSETPHTRGFFERAAVLYHHGRGTPAKRLVWVPFGRGRWRIDWQRTRAESKREIVEGDFEATTGFFPLLWSCILQLALRFVQFCFETKLNLVSVR
jgi:hypothetical protein